MSIQEKYRFLEEAYPDMLPDIGALIQKGKIANRFEAVELTQEELQHLEKAKELCELKVIDLWENQASEQFKALCATYFDITTLLPLKAESEYIIYEQVKCIAFGYLGEQWHLVKQYLEANHQQYEHLESEQWNQRLLISSFKALISLVQKNSWRQVSEAVEKINQLRNEQADFEEAYLNQVNEESRPYGAAELVALYHFAKSIDILGQYLIEGRPPEPETQIQHHTTYSREFAQSSGNISLEMLFQYFEALAFKMVQNTIWHTTRGVNSWISKFNRFISNKEDKGVFELLYPQRESIVEGQLLDPAKRAIVVNLPTSSGKTMIAEYRILQALNQFREAGGWVAYVVPTRALVNQAYIQLNNDFQEIGLKVEKASGAIELDGFEQHLVNDSGNETDFDVLITTYEKLNLLVRQGLGTTAERPLTLTVVDEAHNIEDDTRGLNLELLLSTIKNDCEEANFLLMTPDISNSRDVIDWLAGDRGRDIHLNLHWWQPNERLVGAIEVNGRGRNYGFQLRPLHTEKGTYDIGEAISLEEIENSDRTRSQISNSKVKIASCLASQILKPGDPVIVLAANPGKTYDVAEELYQASDYDFTGDEEIDLLIRLVQTELGADFPLVKYLGRGIGVHSSGLPDEIRFLVEDLMSKGKLQALAATTTIAQGINFPISTVLMSSYHYPYKRMPVRDFWNLAGRVGRAGQEGMGWVGIASRNTQDLRSITEYVAEASEELRSQLVEAIDNALQNQFPDGDFGQWLLRDERWSAILQYISHLRQETEQLNDFLANLEQKLQGTFGYRQLNENQRRFFRNQVQQYAESLTLENAKQADKTGFSTISVRRMIGQLSNTGLTSQDWQKNQLFSQQNQSMQELVGIMMNTHEIRNSIQKLNQGGASLDRAHIARLITDWVNGKDINSIANRFNPEAEDQVKAVQDTTRALYQVVANAATWGLAALQSMPNSGLDWDNMTETEKNQMANIPAYLHYGVNTDEGVLMRKNNVPRSIANRLGQLFSADMGGEIFNQPSSAVSQWLGQQNMDTWNQVLPDDSRLSGEDYKKVWKKLSGIE